MSQIKDLSGTINPLYTLYNGGGTNITTPIFSGKVVSVIGSHSCYLRINPNRSENAVTYLRISAAPLATLKE